MKITGAKVVNAEEKSKQEIEAKLVEEHEKSVAGATEENPVDAATQESVEQPTTENIEADPQPTIQEPELSEDRVLSFIKEKVGREVNSFDDLVEYKEKEVELPEDVKAFYEYKQKTGRSLKDFIEINKDYDSMSSEELVRNYYKQTSSGLDDEDVNFEINRKYSYDNDLDDDDDIRLKKIALKKEAAKAKEYFNQQKEQFNVPLESSTPLVSDDEREAFEAYQNNKSVEEAQREELMKRSQFFMDKTNEVLNDKFEGFKFKVGDAEVKYNPGDVNKLKETNSSIQNFANKHLDEKGFIKDAEAYHKAMAIANDPDAFFKYAYELGQSQAVGDIAKQGKNVDMDIRNTPQTAKKGGTSARIVGPDNGRKLRIKV
jgi:hypothetical protein